MGTIVLFLSQSGETRDLHRGIEIANSKHILTRGVINVVDSRIAREVNCGVYLNSGREVAVASTKSFTSMVVVLVLIAIYIAQINDYNKFIREKYISDLKILSKNIENTIRIYEKNIQKYIESFKRKNSLFILGKGPDRAIAREGALKIKEISYIHAEGYSSSSLKHGPFALLEKDYPVILLAPDNEYYYKSINIYQEIKSRKANILFITNRDKDDLIDDKIIVPYNSKLYSLLFVVILQLLAYDLSVSKGINPDKPKNLAKVVTVE